MVEMFLAEVLGTGALILLGDGVVAGVLLSKSKAQNTGWIVITTGVGVRRVRRRAHRRTGQRRAPQPGGHARVLASTARSTWAEVPVVHWAGEMLGAFIGAVLVFLHYFPHWAETEDADLKLAVFSTGPGHPQPDMEPRQRDHRHVRAGVRDLRLRGHRPDGTASPSSAPCPWRSSCSSSACRSAARPATRSTPPATSGRGSPTSSCRSPASATRTGATPGSRSSVRSSARRSRRSSTPSRSRNSCSRDDVDRHS